jgi:acyl carrier protein
MPAATLYDELVVLLRERVGPDVTIHPSTTICGELGLGSIELLELSTELEDRLGLQLPDEALPGLRTVGDLARALEKSGVRR